MSLRSHIWALDDAPVDNPTEALVLIALADEANDEGRAACPYMEKMVHRGRCSARSVQTHLRELFRKRLISLGDQGVARRRYNKHSGLAPRVWDLNMSARWDNVPVPRTDEEMLEYSDRIGQRPARRQAPPAGVQDLHPCDEIQSGGVQDLHPSNIGTNSDELPGMGADLEGAGVQWAAPLGVQIGRGEGCSPLHPSRLPLTTRLSPPLVGPLTRDVIKAVSGGEDSEDEPDNDDRAVGGWSPPHPDDRTPPPPRPSCTADGEESAGQPGDRDSGAGLAAPVGPVPADEGEPAAEDPLTRIVRWFRGQRPDWAADAVERALLTAVERGQARTVEEAARGLRELIGDAPHGHTDHPGRLYSMQNAPWWRLVLEARARADAAREATRARCGRHRGELADNCGRCLAERKAVPDEDAPAGREIPLPAAAVSRLSPRIRARLDLAVAA